MWILDGEAKPIKSILQLHRIDEACSLGRGASCAVAIPGCTSVSTRCSPHSEGGIHPSVKDIVSNRSFLRLAKADPILFLTDMATVAYYSIFGVNCLTTINGVDFSDLEEAEPTLLLEILECSSFSSGEVSRGETGMLAEEKRFSS